MSIVPFARLVAALGVAVSLIAIAEDRVPEPNEANCSGEKIGRASCRERV